MIGGHGGKPGMAALLAAWGVHLLTASGAVFGLAAMAAAARGDAMLSFKWMMLTVAIDSVDGMLARRFRVKEVAPGVDGALLDNIVDYFTYTLVPVSFLHHIPLLPEGWLWPVSAAVSVSSAYQFCRTDAKTADHTFSGFPSYWNIAVFYLFIMGLPQGFNLAVLLLCAAGSFLPLRCLYPSRTPMLRPLSIALGGMWALSLAAALFMYPEGHMPLVWFSWIYILYYVAFSAWLTLRTPERPGGPA